MRIYWDLYSAWFRMGLFTFGGGYAMLPMIQREVIEKYHWATEDEVMDYYAVGQCTPGIIAVNTATFIGYKVKGTLGGIVATLGVISPSLVIITLIAGLITNFSDLAVVQHALKGIQVGVCVLMFVSVRNLFLKGVKQLPDCIVFIAAFLLAQFTDLSTVILVIAAGAVGYARMILKEKNV
ncbi:MAG: chromate transporter [Solobacterium sp.]|nr:chromate transporter [Solobacterium sp.]